MNTQQHFLEWPCSTRIRTTFSLRSPWKRKQLKNYLLLRWRAFTRIYNQYFQSFIFVYYLILKVWLIKFIFLTCRRCFHFVWPLLFLRQSMFSLAWTLQQWRRLFGFRDVILVDSCQLTQWHFLIFLNLHFRWLKVSLVCFIWNKFSALSSSKILKQSNDKDKKILLRSVGFSIELFMFAIHVIFVTRSLHNNLWFAWQFSFCPMKKRKIEHVTLSVRIVCRGNKIFTNNKSLLHCVKHFRSQRKVRQQKKRRNAHCITFCSSMEASFLCKTQSVDVLPSVKR